MHIFLKTNLWLPDEYSCPLGEEERGSWMGQIGHLSAHILCSAPGTWVGHERDQL